MGESSIDELDRRILTSLYADFTKDRRSLADELNVDEERLTKRINELQNHGIIERPTAVVDPGALGFTIPSYHFIGLAQNYDDALSSGMPFFEAFTGSQLAMVVLGEYDLILRKLSESDARLNNFMNNLINDPDYPRYERSETYRVTERMRWRGFDISEDSRFDVAEYNLSETERNVLQVLRRSGRLRTKPNEISQRVNASSGTVMDIVRDLEESDVILGYSVDIDFDKLGWNRAFLGLSSLRGGYEEVIESVREVEPLHAPYMLSGSGFSWCDIGVELRFDSLDELDELTDRIRTAGGARETRTFLSTKTLTNKPFSLD